MLEDELYLLEKNLCVCVCVCVCVERREVCVLLFPRVCVWKKDNKAHQIESFQDKT